jgi:hypothetical protein
MKLDPARKLFLGVKIDAKTRDELGRCPPRERVYFEGNDPAYLRVAQAGQDVYIGKVVEPVLPLKELDDLKRHVSSILSLIRSTRLGSQELTLLACAEGGEDLSYSIPRKEPEPGRP